MLTIVSCYYKLRESKHTQEEYINWIDNFLTPLLLVAEKNINVSIVLFTSRNDKYVFKNHENSVRFKIVELEFTEFFVHKYANKWNEQYLVDPERNIHNPYLYMLWNEKFYFVNRVIKAKYFNADMYAWMDIGMVRDSRLQSFIVQRFDPNVAHIATDKIHFFTVGNMEPFMKMDMLGISLVNKKPHLRYSVSGNFFYGHKDTLSSVIPKFYDLLNLYIENRIFAGKDQNVYANLICKHPNYFKLLHPTTDWTSVYQSNIWFYGINFYAVSNPPSIICCPKIEGGLGNQLFQIASTFGIAQRNGGLFVINTSHIQMNAHSKINYVDTVFNKFIVHSPEIDEFLRIKTPFDFSPSLFNIPKKGCYLIGEYLQCVNYFHSYRKELISLLNLPAPSNFTHMSSFIHLRYGDYVNHPLHYVDLGLYYKRAIDYFRNIYDSNMHFRVFSNDMNKAKSFCKTVGLKNISFDESSDEVQSLSDMRACFLGGICANSTFSWWGGYLNPNEKSIICLPNKWFNEGFKTTFSSQTSEGLLWKNTKIIHCE